MTHIEGGVSKVKIDNNIVTKTYYFEQDCLLDSPYAFMTTELVILNLLNGTDGFPKIIDVILEPPKYSIVMPYLGRPITKVDYSRELLTQILYKVDFLHAHDIVHCDIKPDNIVIDDHQKISIIDFSHSFIMTNFDSPTQDHGQPTGQPTGQPHGQPHDQSNGQPHKLTHHEIFSTYAYIAPESYNMGNHKTRSVDVWGLGCLLYELVTGQCLFKNEDTTEIDHRASIIKMITYHCNLPKIYEKIDKIIGYEIEKTLMKQIFQIDPDKRPTIRQLIESISVPYICPQQLYNVNTKNDYHYSDSRLRCWDFPHSLCMFVDHLRDQLIFAKMNVDQYQLVYLVHMIIGVVFYNKNIIPYDVLCAGCNYMSLLTHIIKNINLSIIYLDIWI
jgi:serine/threonine protein kinase